MSGSDVEISVVNIYKSFGDKVALNNVSFNVKGGKIIGLLGPNGSGKTTLMRIMLGFIAPDKGYVNVMGYEPYRNQVEVRRLIGYVPENVVLYDSLTPREYLSLIASIRMLNNEGLDRVENLVRVFGLDEYMETLIGGLSKGNRQKVAIISALMHNPPILIMDEPIIGLDAVSARVLKDLIRSKAEKGGLVILSTHILELAEKLCDYIILLHRGVKVAEGTPTQISKISGGIEDIILEVTGYKESLRDILDAIK